MAPTNKSIRDFFQPTQSRSAQPADQLATSISPAAPISDIQASQRIVRSSDDEESGSDTSFEDFAVSLQFQTSKPCRTSSPPSGFRNSTNGRSRGVRKPVASPLSPAKPKYQFDMKKLISQAEEDNITEASAQRVKALLETPASKASTPGDLTPRDAGSDLLELVVADAEGTTTDDIKQALKRTEATIIEKRCYLFDVVDDGTIGLWPLSTNSGLEGWQASMADPQLREQIVLSSFAKDMVNLGDNLPDDLLLWILDETCLEVRSDLRQAYCNILLASTEQISDLVLPETVMNLFHRIGGTDSATDIHREVQPVAVYLSAYEGRDWSRFRAAIMVMGQIADYLQATTKIYTLNLLLRLCVDQIILDHVGLLDATQRSLEQLSQSIEGNLWEQCCRDICATMYPSIRASSLQIQVLRCIPRTTPRLHELRRRLALAYFFEDINYSTKKPADMVDLWEISKYLNGAQFKITRETDYHHLAAKMSMLDALVDNGLSSQDDIDDHRNEKDFNEDIDALTARVKNMASSINDAGASFMSRIDAKEVMEGFRHRLTLAVRTKPKPRPSIFDTVSDDSGSIRKQSDLMKRHFTHIKSDAR